MTARKKTKKTTTERIEDAVFKSLEGEKVDKLLVQLSDDEQQMFWDVVTLIREGKGDDGMLDNLWRIDYERKPPTISEFIDDDYWLGSLLRPSEESEGLFPFWRHKLVKDFDIDSKIHNLVITGSLGIGKTFILVTLLLYRVVLSRLLRNPQAFLGLTRGSRISYVILSLTRSQVRATAFGDAMNFMANCPFFIEECSFDVNSTYSGNAISLGRNIWLSAGSKGFHVIGQNTMGICLDEGNWRLEANPDLKAYQLYDEARTRIQNRFQTVAGFLPAISILASSAKDESSFTEKVITDIHRANDPLQQIVYRTAVYKVKAHKMKLDKRHFRVAYGMKNADPYVLSGVCDESGVPMSTDVEFEKAPDDAAVECVPWTYWEAFNRDVKKNLQSISGISTGGSNKLFNSMVDFQKCLDISADEGIVNPVKMGVIPLSVEDNYNLWDYLDHKKFLTRVRGSVVPLRQPYSQRYAHVDLATENLAGIAICHVTGRQRVDNLVDMQGMVYAEHRQLVEYDAIITLTSGRQKPISFEKIMKFFIWLRHKAGFKFAHITCDQWQSEMVLQMLESRGFSVSKLSLDRTKTPYYTFRDAVTEHRIRLGRHEMLYNELKNLVDGPKKVDHPPESDGGSKDTSDAVAGAYYNAVSHGLEEALRAGGAEGGADVARGASQSADSHAPIEIPVKPDKPRDPNEFYA